MNIFQLSGLRQGPLGINPESDFRYRFFLNKKYELCKVGKLDEEKRNDVTGHYEVVKSRPIWQAENLQQRTFVFRSNALEVDHDGGKTYHPPSPQDRTGRSFGANELLENASSSLKIAYDRTNPDKIFANGKRWDHVGNTPWCALALRADGYPYIQGPNDPYEGFYVTQTGKFYDHENARKFDPRRYPDSNEIPYVVCYKQIWKLGVRQGDVCTVVVKRGQNIKPVHAFVGDAKGFGHGEASQAVHDAFRPRGSRSGYVGDVIILFYPNTVQSRVWSPSWGKSYIDQKGSLEYAKFGGDAAIQQFFPV